MYLMASMTPSLLSTLAVVGTLVVVVSVVGCSCCHRWLVTAVVVVIDVACHGQSVGVGGEWWCVLGLGKNLVAVWLDQQVSAPCQPISHFHFWSSTQPMPAKITTNPTSDCQPTTTPMSVKDNGNQPNNTIEGSSDDHQPIGTTFLFSFFFFCFTNDLPSSSLTPLRMHDTKHHEDNGTMHMHGHQHPPHMHTVSLFFFFSSFILLIIYFPMQHLLTYSDTYNTLPLASDS